MSAFEMAWEQVSSAEDLRNELLREKQSSESVPTLF